MEVGHFTFSQKHIFVGGPMQYAIGPTGFDCSLKNLICLVIEHLLTCNYNVFSAHLEENFGIDTALFTPEQVTMRDYRWMQDCDLFVAILPVAKNCLPYRSEGTHVELGWASALAKPVLIVTDTHCIERLSHLVRGLGQLTHAMIISAEEILVNPRCLNKPLEMLTNRDFKIGLSR